MNLRRMLIVGHDLGAAAAAWTLAYLFRFNLEIPDEHLKVLVATLPLVVAVHAVVFALPWIAVSRGLWRYTSLPDLQRIVIAAGLGGMAVPSLLAFVRIEGPIPRTVYLLAPVLLGLMMGASRFFYRAWREGRLAPLVTKPHATPVLVLGADAAAAALLKDLATSAQWHPVGVLDDDEAKQGSALVGVKVLGTVGQVGEVAKRLGVTQAIIAMPGATHGQRKRAVELCAKAGIAVMTVPSVTDIVSGKVSVSALRPVELDDLLGRDPVQLDDAGLHGFLNGRTVLVTGAGGSIGAELCRQIGRFGPARIILYEISEYALYSIEQEFRDRYSGVAIAAVIGDAKDEARVSEVFARYRPEVLFHAAAYKHVPLMEEDNAFQAVVNNVRSTLVVARAAQAVGVAKFVLISTDKAVNPVNVMGASKRLAEMACQALQAESRMEFVIVRFGNVLGSNGSVVPRFREQIARGGPITVTHPDIERYFMSIPEAAQLVLQAALMGHGGEIYVLDMGEPVKIAELAKQLIQLSGLSEQDIRIEYTGLRPGEKLYEEPIADAEKTLRTPHPKLRVALARGAQGPGFVEDLLRWMSNAHDVGSAAVRERLRAWILEYAPGRGAAAQAAPRAAASKVLPLSRSSAGSGSPHRS